MLRHVLGLGGVGGMFTFMSTCDTRACYVTSWVGWGGGGCSRSCELATHAHATSRLGLGGVGAVFRLLAS